MGYIIIVSDTISHPPVHDPLKSLPLGTDLPLKNSMQSPFTREEFQEEYGFYPRRFPLFSAVFIYLFTFLGGGGRGGSACAYVMQ